MQLQVKAFLTSLGLMVEGMLGIFAVMLLIMGVILLLNRLTADKEKP
ncbi:MAG: hypothetical protein PUH70_11805 [Clostridiales bacterium]|nr:hypothetical protein [Clostridiales bacterium]MDY5350503.1 hypothetical protein [Candidatus Ventricola sp.]MDY5514904.1 hypothetical protein [Candidatus Ventricola sp.]